MASERIAAMRRASILVAAIACAVPGTTSVAPDGHTTTQIDLPGRLSLRVPAGWHELHGWLSDVTDPVPRLAVASFPAKLSRHTCECGFPNVIRFPRDGAFVFVWEYPHPSSQARARTPNQPVQFQLAAQARVRQTCNGPTDTFAFKREDRVFQAEVYLGPATGPALRHQLAAVLDSLHVAPRA